MIAKRDEADRLRDLTKKLEDDVRASHDKCKEMENQMCGLQRCTEDLKKDSIAKSTQIQELEEKLSEGEVDVCKHAQI